MTSDVEEREMGFLAWSSLDRYRSVVIQTPAPASDVDPDPSNERFPESVSRR